MNKHNRPWSSGFPKIAEGLWSVTNNSKTVFTRPPAAKRIRSLHTCCTQARLHQNRSLSQLSDSVSIKYNTTERDLPGHRLQLPATVGSTTRIRTLMTYAKLQRTLSVRKGTALTHVPTSVWLNCAHLSNFQQHWGFIRKPGRRERCTGGTNTCQLSSLPHFVCMNTYTSIWETAITRNHGQPKRAEQDEAMVAWSWSNCAGEIRILCVNKNPGVLKSKK